LSVTVGMLFAFNRLAIGLKAVALEFEHFAERDAANYKALRPQFSGE